MVRGVTRTTRFGQFVRTLAHSSSATVLMSSLRGRLAVKGRIKSCRIYGSVVRSTAVDVLLTVVRGMAGKVSVAIPGPSDALVVFVGSRWRVADVDHFMATSSNLVDPLVLFPHPGML